MKAMVDTNTDPQDQVITQVPKQTKTDVQEVEVDTKPIIEEVTEEVTKQVTGKIPQADKIAETVKDKIIDTLKGDEADKDAAPWKKEGRQPRNYEEVAKWGKDEAKKEMKAEQVEKDKVTKEKEKETAEGAKKRQEDWSKYWDGQIDKLVEEGKIPAPADEIKEKLAGGKELTSEEKEDPGVKARKDLYDKANETKETNLRLVFFEHYDKDKKPTGSQAPVFGSRKAVTPTGQGEEYTWEEINKARSLRDLLPDK